MTTLSSKFTNLITLQKAGIESPKTLLLNNLTGFSEVFKFIEHCNKDTQTTRFIVRSIQLAEDKHTSSFAGHFWSSGAITANEIEQTIQLAKLKNQEILRYLGLQETPQLMLQEHIEHTIGGVMFSPWGFFSDFIAIEYSNQSVQKVVEGLAKPAILSQDITERTHPLPLPSELGFLVKPLQTICIKLKQLFAFPLDCEWAYCAQRQRIIILQVRPQTTPIGSVLGTPPASILQHTKSPKGDWQYSALSESLGRLSPLSFSLFMQLYEDSKAAFQSLGYQAQQLDFMQRMPDGTVLTDSQREKNFYSSTRMGGFWRGFRAPKWQQESNEFIQTKSVDSAFSYSRLSISFQLWMIANTLSKGKGRETPQQYDVYELSWRSFKKTITTSPSENKQLPSKNKKTWDQLNPILRQLFFNELEKLKYLLAKTPEYIFSNWEEYLQATEIKNGEMRQKELKQHQKDATLLALYDFSLINQSKQTAIQSIGVKKKVSGKVFFVENPNHLQHKIPDDCILVTPYFSNQWVHKIKYLSAIIVARGGQLSHSAIVAREYGVPYFIVPSKHFKKIINQYKQGDTLQLEISGEFY